MFTNKNQIQKNISNISITYIRSLSVNLTTGYIFLFIYFKIKFTALSYILRYSKELSFDNKK